MRATDVWSFRERSLGRRSVTASNDSPAKGTEVFRTAGGKLSEDPIKPVL